MKNNNGFQKQVIDSAQSRRERFAVPYDVYTTTNIGRVQPVGVHPVQAGSKITFKSRDVVRMLPMVCPTLGRIKYKIWHQFVGMSDLIRSWEALLTKQVIANGGTSVLHRPANLMHMSFNEICAMVLVGAHYSVYVFQSEGAETDPDGARSKWHLYDYQTSTSDTTYNDVRTWINGCLNHNFNVPDAYPNFNGKAVALEAFYGPAYPNGTQVPCANRSLNEFFDVVNPDIGSASWTPVPLDSAHYVWRRDIEVGSNTYKLAIAVRLSELGQSIRKAIIAAGYKVNFCNSESLNLMPLFATWKAYFDVFGLTYWYSWESSFAKILCQRYDNNENPLLHINPSVAADRLVCRFFLDIGQMWYTEDKDYVSAHTTEDAALVDNGLTTADKDRGWLNNIVLDAPNTINGVSGIGQDITDPNNPSYSMTKTRHVFINRVNHTEVDAELLKILYKWTNRETAAGRRIAELLRAAGYGKYVDEQKTNFIGYEEIELNVTDVNATADSQNVVTGHNSVVGEYVGKGVGVKGANEAKTFSFENKEFGYWVTLAAVVVDSGYTQGVDQTLYAIDVDHMYQREMDGMGKELERRSLVVGGTDWSRYGEASEYSISFGMVPRHSMWKVRHNILNGDYSLRGARDYFLPFSMDKWIDVGDRDCELVPNTSGTYRAIKKFELQDLPVAGATWRFLNRYPWLANFERIFTYFDGDVRKFLETLHDVEGLAHWEYCHSGDDHFNIQMLCDMEMYAPMLPISESYGTTDDNDGNGDYTVTAS